MLKFNSETRKSLLEKLSREETTYDLLIVGGGITGAGLARDASLRGLSVLLVEAGDFACGTSSRSSKLIHGGIRYLENMDFKLVFEALSERQRLYQMAPHLVHPLRFIFPVYDFSRVGMLKMACGMWLYDTLSLYQGQGHEQLNVEETLERAPILSSRGLKGSFVYSDATMDDDRLAIETLRSAVENGADCLNYVKAEEVEFKSERIHSVTCRDQEKGLEFKVRAHHVVSTVGPWTDLFGHKVSSEWKDILKPSKGIHLTLARERLPLKEAVVLSDDANERIVFAIPRKDMIIIGTTDTSFSGDPGEVRAEKSEVDYLLKVSEEYFPQVKMTAEDILGTYAGVRPLVKSDEASVGKTSREHTVISDPRGVTFVAGGKYTTYRYMAETILDKILDDFPLEKRVGLRRCTTTDPLNSKCTNEQLLKAKQMVSRWSRESSMSDIYIDQLVDRHGMEVAELLSDFRRDSAVNDEGTYWSLEAHHAIENTMCLHIKDFFWRRSHLFLARKDHGRPWLSLLADVFAEKLGWSSQQREEEVAAVETEIAKELAW